jgi:predicted DNA-binding transcriptional regulator AlpA
MPRPDAGAPGEALYRRAELDTWLAWQRRTGPLPAQVTQPGPGELVALYQFAELIGRRHATVYRYRRKPGFPQPADGVRYRLGDLLAW